MNEILTIVIVAGLILFAIYTIRNYVSKLGTGSCCSSDDTYKVKDRNVNNYSYHVMCDVEGMYCANCAKRIENAFQSRGGILAKADYKTGKVELHLKEEMADEKIAKVIANNGYILKTVQR